MTVSNTKQTDNFSATQSRTQSAQLQAQKHMVRLIPYELTKLIAPNNVSIVRMRDYEDSMKWLIDAAKLRLNPQKHPERWMKQRGQSPAGNWLPLRRITTREKSVDDINSKSYHSHRYTFVRVGETLFESHLKILDDCSDDR